MKAFIVLFEKTAQIRVIRVLFRSNPSESVSSVFLFSSICTVRYVSLAFLSPRDECLAGKFNVKESIVLLFRLLLFRLLF